MPQFHTSPGARYEHHIKDADAVHIAKLEADLRDVLDFASVPISRCTNCKRLAVVKGWICQVCSHDPSDDRAK